MLVSRDRAEQAKEVEVGRGDGNSRPLEWWRPWTSQGRRSCTWSLCATQHTGGTAQTTLEQMRPQGNSAHENEFLELIFSFTPAEGIE